MVNYELVITCNIQHNKSNSLPNKNIFTKYYIFSANVKGATLRYFKSLSAMCKITFNVRETTKY